MNESSKIKYQYSITIIGEVNIDDDVIGTWIKKNNFSGSKEDIINNTFILNQIAQIHINDLINDGLIEASDYNDLEYEIIE